LIPLLLLLPLCISATAAGESRCWAGASATGLRLRGGAGGLKKADFEQLERAAEEQTVALENKYPDAAARWRALQEQWNERAEALAINGMLPPDRHNEMVSPDIPIRRDVMDFLMDEPYIRYFLAKQTEVVLRVAGCESNASLHSPVLFVATTARSIRIEIRTKRQANVCRSF
jgi:hypothetical protein